jgi:hypothetical protein
MDRRDANVTLDGGVVAPAAWGKDMPVDPGSHVAAATAEGRGRFEQAFDLHEGERRVIEVSMPVLALRPAEAPVVPIVAEPATPRVASLTAVPPGFHVERRVRKGLAIGGASLFLTTYSISVLTASIITAANSHCNPSCEGLLWTLFVPGLGPFSAMASPGNSTYGNVALAADAIAQGAGIAMFIAGLTAKHDVLIEDETPAHHATVQWTVAPIAGAGRAGLGVVGTF